MSLLLDLAITPEVFGPAGYSAPERGDDCLFQLEPILMQEAIVRDLAGGRWQACLKASEANLSVAGLKLFRAMTNRIRPCEAVTFPNPQTPDEWCWEAEALHQKEPGDGILVGHETALRNGGDGVVCASERVHQADWWQARACSITMRRQPGDYIRHLERLLRFAKSAVFIDPHLDPTVQRYSEFHKVLEIARRRLTTLHVEVHRSCYRGSGGDRHEISELEATQMFEPLAQKLSSPEVKLRLDVFVWDRFHDRFLITDLLGISVPNGFDVSENADEVTRWTRLSREDRDGVLKEFAPNNPLHRLRFQFSPR